MWQHPLYALILSVMVIIVFAEISIQQGKLYKKTLSLTTINTFIIVMLWILSSIIENDTYTFVVNIIMVIEYVMFAIIIFFISHSHLQKMKNYSNFIDSFKNTSFNVFYLTDKKDRVKEISGSLLLQFGLSRDQVVGKKFFDIVNEKVRFYKIDDVDINNDLLKDFYRDYPKNATANSEVRREIYFYNTHGQTTILNLTERPIFYAGKYQGRMNVGSIKDDMSLMSVEKELINKNDELETMQYKFIASLELTAEGISFNDVTQNYIWCNDNLVKMLNLKSNSLSTNEFFSSIHPDDLYVYKDKLDNLTPENPNYKLTYRFKIGYNYQFITEKGKKIFENTKQNIVSFVNKHESSYFAKTSYKHLDEVKSYDDLVTDVNILYNNNMNFDIVALRTTNLPDINNIYGRKIGDMILAAYIKEVKTNFLSESSDIYRVTGSNFIFTITDMRKMAFLKKCIESANEMMNYKMNYGNTSVILEINLGIAQSYNDARDAQSLINNVKKALTTSLNPNFSSNFAYYKDIVND